MFWKYAWVFSPDEEYGRTEFGKEDTVSTLLDASLDRITIDAVGSYCSISRDENVNWDLICNASNTNFRCLVKAKKLSLYISRKKSASEHLNKSSLV